MSVMVRAGPWSGGVAVDHIHDAGFGSVGRRVARPLRRCMCELPVVMTSSRRWECGRVPGWSRMKGSSCAPTYVAEPKTAERWFAGFNRTGQKVLASVTAGMGQSALGGCKGFGTKGDVMGQQSIGQWPERSELDPRGSVTVDCVDVVHRAGICRSRVCHDEKTGRAQPSRRESQGEQRDDAHPLNPVTAYQAREER